MGSTQSRKDGTRNYPKVFWTISSGSSGREGSIQVAAPSWVKGTPYFSCVATQEHVGTAPTQDSLPVVDNNGAWAKEPVRILDRHVVKKGHHAITKVLVEWADSFPENTTWEPLKQLRSKYPQFDP